MVEKVSYWVAGHLTGLFEIKDSHNDLLYKGSRGAGLSISRGVITSVQYNTNDECEIFFGERKVTRDQALVTSNVIDLLVPTNLQRNFTITHDFEVPLSSGFGASAAGALGTAFSLNSYFDLGYSDLQLYQIAHKSEVLNRGGLGDIIGLFQGGVELRTLEGAPGIGKTLPIEKVDGWNVCTVHLGPLETAGVLGDPMKRSAVNNAGAKLIIDLIQEPTFEKFVQSAYRFTKAVNLASSRLKDHLTRLPEEVVGAQIMLGEAYFIFYKDLEDLKSIDRSVPIINETICKNTVKRCF